MRITADLHSHTLFSGHAFNTATEMINRASEIGLRALAITDHGPGMPDSGHVWHFFNKGQIPKIIDGMVVLYGAEVDVLDKEGTLDIPVKLLSELDWVIASIHKELIPQMSFEDATQLWLNVAENPNIDMIGHCEQAEHFFDYDRVIQKFAQNNKVVELNANSAFVRPLGQKNMVTLAKTCQKYNCKVAVNSDAHSIYKVGNVQNILDMLENIDFPKELIINLEIKDLIKELTIHNKKVVEQLGELI
ncbi:MAG: phosphatase [Oscillospiraceae bacterium]